MLLDLFVWTDEILDSKSEKLILASNLTGGLRTALETERFSLVKVAFKNQNICLSFGRETLS